MPLLRHRPFAVALVCAVALFVTNGCGDDDEAPPPAADPAVADQPSTEAGTADADTAVPDGGPTAPHDFTTAAAGGAVRAGLVTKPGELFEGFKAEGRVGDARLDNASVGFIVEGARFADGYRRWGGYPVDAVRFDAAGRASEDLHGETFASWDLGAFEPTALEIVDDGRSGEAHVRVRGHVTEMDLTTGLLKRILNVSPPPLDVTFDYRLGPDDTALRMTMTLANPASEAIEIAWHVLIAHHGDSVYAWAPGRGLDTSESVGARVPYFGVVGPRRAYGLLANDDLSMLGTFQGLTVATWPKFSIPASGSVQFERWLVVSDNGAAGLDAALHALQGAPSGATLRGTVALPPSAEATRSWVGLFGDEGEAVTMAPVDADGTFSLTAPPGDYAVGAWSRDHAPAPRVDVTLTASPAAEVALAIPAAARVDVALHDQDDRPLAGRVTFLRRGDTPEPFPPEAMNLLPVWRDGASAVAFAPGGVGSVTLPAGAYRAVASAGFSYELAEEDLDVDPGGEASIELRLERAVDTTGWVSADFHVHAVGSLDSFVPYRVRALQAVVDHLDIPIITEHGHVSSLEAALEDDPLRDELVHIVGQEVTTLAYGHFGVFPILWDPTRFNLGAIYPHDKDPIALFEAMRAQNDGDEIIQINHPRVFSAGGYFNHVDLDADLDVVRKPEEWSLDWDTVEVFNGSCGTERNDNGRALQDWIGLTNHGHAKVLASGSDTHEQWRAPGTPRNWIEVEAQALRADPQNLVPVVRGRRLFVSCGPFVRFRAEDGTGLGGRTGTDADGSVTFFITVEAPSWMGVDEIRLWQNGEALQTWLPEAGATPAVRLDTSVTVTPAADAWYAVEVIGSGSLQPVSRTGPPYALTNPIEIDADGDGAWTPPALQ